MYKIKRFIDKIKKVFYWLPYIWRDEDWDYTYIYELLYAKLNRMEDYWRNNENFFRSGSHDNDLKRIKIAKILCKRLSNEDYLNNTLFWYHKKYGNDTLLEFCSYVKKDGLVIVTYDGEKNKTREKEFHKACKKAEFIKEQDKKYLFNLLKNRIEEWWI